MESNSCGNMLYSVFAYNNYVLLTDQCKQKTAEHFAYILFVKQKLFLSRTIKAYIFIIRIEMSHDETGAII